MASPRRRLPAGSGSAADCRQTLSKIRRSVSRGTAEKLFEDDHFVFELIEVLNDETVDITVKTEFLCTLEQYGCDHISASSAEKVLSSLLDVLRENRGRAEILRFLVQLLLSITTLLIQNDLLKSNHCATFTTVLWEIVGRVNDVATRRLRSCACQCLRQLEIWSPGMLSKQKDRILHIVREERTGVFQDYAALLSTVLSNLTTSRETAHKSNTPAEDVLPPLSYLMDNVFLFTPAALWSVVLSVLNMVKTTDHVGPSIFKPLMLQNMATFDPCLLHIIVYIQKELQGEILTKAEEMQMLQRLTSGINLLSLHPALRLLLLQWLKGYVQVAADEQSTDSSDSHLRNVVRHHLHPSVFDSLDIHVDKLTVLTHSFTAQGDQKLVDNIYYLKRLALTTGNEQATVGLYRVLFAAYTQHRTQHLAEAVLKITQDLVVDYPHLIPLILDFLEAVKERIGEGSVYKATLSSLHDQVLNGGQGEVLAQFRFCLQVLSVSAKQQDIPQNKTVRFLLSLVRYAEQRGACNWELGSTVLAICRNLLLHHSSDHLHYDLGELLYEMLMCFTDTAIRSRARLLYALLSGSSDEKLREVLGTQLLGGAVLGQNITSILSGTMSQSNKTELVVVDDAGLKMERLSLSSSYNVLPSPCNDCKHTSLTGRLGDYYRRLSCLQTELVAHLKLTLEPSAPYEMISAVSISVKSQTDAFSHVKDLHLLSLAKHGSQSVCIKLVPKVPQPSAFTVRSMFCTEDNSTVTCPLQPLEITFGDLTLPLPWQHLELHDVKDKQVMFGELWQHFTETGGNNSAHGIESVKVLKCSVDKLRQEWKSFHVPTDEDDQTGDDKYLIFLPPTFHLLFRVHTQGQNQVISMATDCWKLLPSINNYLNSLNLAA